MSENDERSRGLVATGVDAALPRQKCDAHPGAMHSLSIRL